MKIKRIKVNNFKGLKEIEFNTHAKGVLIVGPNAVGKSTIFEAIRLNKAFLYPNTQGEIINVLNSHKAISPDQQTIIIDNLLNDKTKKLEIAIDYEIEDAEIDLIKSNFLDKYAIRHLQNTNRFPSTRETFTEAQFLSSEQGKKAMEEGRFEVSNHIQSLKSTKKLKASFILEPNALHFGENLLDQEFILTLCESTGYSRSYFNYFPADRSLPFGDQPVQIGFGNATQQLQSYIAHPQSKYQFLKQFIINMYLSTESNRDKITETFNFIFDSLLPGKKIGGLEINHTGNLTIWINDQSKSTKYDLDNMSSGEKNLILTLLFMDLTTMQNGIVLFDEPELHLNPAVQKKIINFLMDGICVPKNRQVLLCTHSPEMFASAFERSDSVIFHLISPRDISPIYKEDKKEVFHVLHQLGASSSDFLSTRGVVYLEGPHDVEILEEAFSIFLPGFIGKHLGGRQEIEKAIKILQEEESKDKLDSFQYFLFDLDNLPTTLQSTEKVKVTQWDRYCLENYLIDSDSIYDMLREKTKPEEELTRGSLQTKIKEIAFTQVKKKAIKEVLKKSLPDELYIKTSKFKLENSNEAYATLKNTLDSMNQTSSSILKNISETKFIEKIEDIEKQLIDDWQSDWKNHCDGKLLLADIQKIYKINLSLLDFKKKILEISKNKNSENWQLIEAKLKSFENK
jgi:predicted ATP-dependent endonuclease of OLD family